MDAQPLTVLLLKATVLLMVGGAVAAGLRRAPAGTRYLVWLATLAGVLALPALMQVAPLRLEILPAVSMPAPPAATIAGTGDVAEASVDEAGTAGGPIAAATRAASDRRAAGSSFPRPTLAQAGLILWMLVALGIAGWLALGARAVRRILLSARPLDDAQWRAALCEVADRLGLATLPRLLASDRIEIPFAAGAWSSTIVVPANAEQWTEERRRLVLFHELAHVRRRDLLGHTLGRLACAVYWFHPLVWAAARRLRAESERACDDLVLACGARASDYADHLLDIVSAARRQTAPATALPMARRREFEGRVLAILDPALRRSGPGRLQSAGLLAGLAVLFLSVAASAPSQPAPTPAPASVSSDPGTPAPAPTARPAPRPRPAPRAVAADEPAKAGAAEQEPAPAPARDHDRRALLIKILRTDPDASVRRSAAWALAHGTQGDEIGVLIAALRGDADAEVREMAAWALADLRGEDATAALGEALRKDQNDEVRATAAWALGQRRRVEPAVLLAALRDHASEVRKAAIWALGHHRLESAPPELTAALRDSDSEVRVVAAWALGELLDPATAPAVRAAFAAEKDDEAARAMFRALAFLGDRSPEFVDRALASKDPEIRSRAVRLMGGLGPGIWPWPWPWPRPRPFP